MRVWCVCERACVLGVSVCVFFGAYATALAAVANAEEAKAR